MHKWIVQSANCFSNNASPIAKFEMYCGQHIQRNISKVFTILRFFTETSSVLVKTITVKLKLKHAPTPTVKNIAYLDSPRACYSSFVPDAGRASNVVE